MFTWSVIQHGGIAEPLSKIPKRLLIIGTLAAARFGVTRLDGRYPSLKKILLMVFSFLLLILVIGFFLGMI